MEPELFSAAFLSGLLTIVLIDLVLAGDNALIIGLVARNLPKDTQRQVILWGTFGAIAIRAVMAILVVYILDVPGFMLAGGLALIWIARKLLTPDQHDESSLVKGPATSLFGAIRTIVIADAVMGIDNVLAIGGAGPRQHPADRDRSRHLGADHRLGQPSGHQAGRPLPVGHPAGRCGAGLDGLRHDRARAVPAAVVRGPSAGEVPGRRADLLPVARALVFARLPETMKPLVVLLPAMLVWMLGFEVASSVWKVQVDYLLATTNGEYMLDGLRWLGWLPLAATYLWLREQFAARGQRVVRS